MGLLKRLFLGRWLVRWLFRGGPWSIALKLAGAALWGAWRLRREGKRTERERRKLEIDADYEVVPEGRLEPGSGARNPGAARGYGPHNTSPSNEERIHFDPREETS
ncbi:MAG: hypothetical protein ACREK3_02015 [Gemmatimonadota bacterium]